jgi:hypothetical protein
LCDADSFANPECVIPRPETRKKRSSQDEAYAAQDDIMRYVKVVPKDEEAPYVRVEFVDYR